MCSSSPDPDPNIGKAALANVQLSKDMIDYFKEKDKQQAPRQEAMDKLTTEVAQQQIASSRRNDAQAQELWRRYQETGVPMENAMMRDATEYDSEEAKERAAGQAGTDAAAQLSAASDMQRRTQQRMGVNPADGRALSMEQDMASTGALGTAAAMNKARTDRELQGIMLRKDAASAARGMPGTAAQTYGVASAAGGQAAGAVGSAIGSANSIAASMGAGFNGAVGANNSAASILNQQYSTQSANSGGGLGEIMGAAGSLGSGLGAMGVVLSDKNAKENRAPVDDEEMLEGVRKTPIESWSYKDDSPGADGGQPHIGAMAQDMQKNLGDKVAPGGKLVDVISAVGANMAATKALDKKVTKLAGIVAKGAKA
jgi:hypothetical protein